MTTLSSPDSPDQERDELVTQQDQRQSLASNARALVWQVQAIASRGSKRQQDAWHEHIEALADLVRFAECPDPQALLTRRTPMTLQQRRSFGALLRDRRNAAGFSRIALARRAKVSDATVKFLETARNPPSRSTLIRLLAVPELKLTWENVPGKLGDAPNSDIALASDRNQPATAADSTTPGMSQRGFQSRRNCTRDQTPMVKEIGIAAVRVRNRRAPMIPSPTPNLQSGLSGSRKKAKAVAKVRTEKSGSDMNFETWVSHCGDVATSPAVRAQTSGGTELRRRTKNAASTARAWRTLMAAAAWSSCESNDPDDANQGARKADWSGG